MNTIIAIGYIGTAVIGAFGYFNLVYNQDTRAAFIRHDRLLIVMAIWISALVIATLIAGVKLCK